MPLRSPTFNILLFSADSEIQAHYRGLFGEQAITLGQDGLALPKDYSKRGYDAVIVESKGPSPSEIGKLFATIDPAHTLLLVGSRSVLKRTAALLQSAKTFKLDTPLSTGAGQSSVWNPIWNIKSGIS